jgi:hypothetical protein
VGLPLRTESRESLQHSPTSQVDLPSLFWQRGRQIGFSLRCAIAFRFISMRLSESVKRSRYGLPGLCCLVGPGVRLVTSGTRPVSWLVMTLVCTAPGSAVAWQQNVVYAIRRGALSETEWVIGSAMHGASAMMGGKPGFVGAQQAKECASIDESLRPSDGCAARHA